MTPRQRLFVDAFLGPAAGNATKAALAAGYSAKAARQAGYKLLQKPQIVAALGDKRVTLATHVAVADDVIRTRVMTGQAALERLTTLARADITDLLPPQHPLRLLPPEVRMTIREIRPTEHGEVLKLHDAMRACELLARAAGALKEVVQVESLEDLLDRSWKYRRPETAA